jgi:hypothetical protein
MPLEISSLSKTKTAFGRGRLLTKQSIIQQRFDKDRIPTQIMQRFAWEFKRERSVSL